MEKEKLSETDNLSDEYKLNIVPIPEGIFEKPGVQGPPDFEYRAEHACGHYSQPTPGGWAKGCCSWPW